MSPYFYFLLLFFYTTWLSAQNVGIDTLPTTTFMKPLAVGKYSIALGNGTIAYSCGEWVLGSYNTPYFPIDGSQYHGLDRLFVLGNGTSDSTRSNALTIYKNGSININDSYQLPNLDGKAGQVLTTDGKGLVRWQYPTISTTSIPKNTADTSGNLGDIRWDDHFIYIKTKQGWKRTTLATF